MRRLVINGRLINDDSPAWVICEIGHNHGGSIDVCQHMIRAAADAGADAVKLQKRDNKTLYTKAYYERPYTSEHAFGATYGEHREALEFNPAGYRTLDEYSAECGVTFFATAFDCASAAMLAVNTACPAFKMASGDLTNTPLLKYVAAYQRPMILSTGAASDRDVDRAVNAVWPINRQLALLQCTALYPAPADKLDLRVITTYRERYPDVTIGLSSHYSGISDVVAAYVLGARIFEKHFTLDRTSKGTDHAFSLEPSGFTKMVSYLAKTRAMLGSNEKVIRDEEQPALEKMGKSLYAAHDLKRGQVLTREDVAIKSPGKNGYAPFELDLLIGHTMLDDVAADEPLWPKIRTKLGAG